MKYLFHDCGPRKVGRFHHGGRDAIPVVQNAGIAVVVFHQNLSSQCVQSSPPDVTIAPRQPICVLTLEVRWTGNPENSGFPLSDVLDSVMAISTEIETITFLGDESLLAQFQRHASLQDKTEFIPVERLHLFGGFARIQYQ